MNEKQKIAAKLTESLCDAGKIIEGGFAGFKLMVYSAELPKQQEQDLRNCFFAGAQHLFQSIMSVLESGSEPTEKDMNRMSLIHQELEEFIKSFELHQIKTEGNA